jgi:hypothetical protein
MALAAKSLLFFSPGMHQACTAHAAMVREAGRRRRGRCVAEAA